MPTLIITEKTSQARDLRAALGERFGQILPAEGHLLRLAGDGEIPVRRDLFRYYHSDAQSAVTAGHDIRTALLAFGCDATHGYERTHIDSLAALSRLIGAYLLSPPVFASDAQPAREQSLERFSHQIEHDLQMSSDTPLPTLDSVLGQPRQSDPD